MNELQSAAEIYEKGRMSEEASRDIQKHLENVMSATDRPQAEALALVAVTKFCDFLNHWNKAAHPEDLRVRDTVKTLGNQLQRAIEQPDLKVIALLRYGNGFFHRTQGEHDKALVEFDTAWSLSKKAGKPLPQALSQSGAEHVYLGQPKEALAQFRRAIDHSAEKKHVRGYCFWAMGRCLAFQEQYDEAIAWLRLAFEQWGEASYVPLYLASCYEWIGEREAAVTMLRHVDETFGTYTLSRVIADERTNPNENPFVVDGRDRFHEGLRRAGMPKEIAR